jgi:hypothetical protein
MSVYSFLLTPVPTIAYCVLHQAHSNLPEEQYIETMREFHARIRQESTSIQEGYQRFLEETASRELQSIRSSLSEFLHTPLRPDEEEVDRRIRESLDRVSQSLLDATVPGLFESIEGKIGFPQLKQGAEMRVFHNGREYLKGLGFELDKGAGPVFESMFVIQGGVNLDTLEHIVRDRLGIYARPHGNHIKEFIRYGYTVYNRIYAVTTIQEKKDQTGHHELALFFSKPDPDRIKYAPFRNGICQALDKLVAAIGIEHIALWQRKLGLGVGVEFVLRMTAQNIETLLGSLEWLAAYKEKEFVKEVLVDEGRAVTKQLLF